MDDEARESQTGEADVLAAGISGEEYLRRDEELLDGAARGEEPKVVELPPKIEHLQAKQARLQQEINICQAQINELAGKMETAQLAFQQCVVLLQAERLNIKCR